MSYSHEFLGTLQGKFLVRRLEKHEYFQEFMENKILGGLFPNFTYLHVH